jgi:hypothetical protein
MLQVVVQPASGVIVLSKYVCEKVVRNFRNTLSDDGKCIIPGFVCSSHLELVPWVQKLPTQHHHLEAWWPLALVDGPLHHPKLSALDPPTDA